MQSDSTAPRLRAYIPKFYHYDPRKTILVLELLPGARNLAEYHRRLGYFPVRWARALAEALSALHQLTWKATGDMGWLQSVFSPPPALFAHRPDVSTITFVSSANVKLVQIIQEFPELCAPLDNLGQNWRSKGVIHGDIKWSNCLISQADAKGNRQFKLIDWELASIGDPCWDIGSVFNDYLSFWLLSIPITGEDPPDRYLEMARYPLAKMQPAIRAFWQAYTRRMKLDPATAEEWLIRSVRYCAARLVQTAYEEGQMGQQVTGNAVCMLQLAYNILLRPQEAALHLLGIPVLGAWRV
jgi:thiamine kinase-like enzyme